MSLWEDDPRTDEELLAAYCVRAEEAGEDWWAFPRSLARGEKHGVPRRAADQAEFIRAYLLLGHEPGDGLHSSVISGLVMKVRELDRKADGQAASR